jgi:hypothetical protein
MPEQNSRFSYVFAAPIQYMSVIVECYYLGNNHEKTIFLIKEIKLRQLNYLYSTPALNAA